MQQVQLYNVTFVCGQTCGRASKMAETLMSRGHRVNLICQGFPSDWSRYGTVNTCMNDEQTLRAIELLSGSTDVFHVHNEPSKYVSMIKSVSKTPVVLDVHDTYLTRNGVHMTDEAANFIIADGLVFVTDYVRQVVREEFGISSPSRVFHSFVPFSYYSYASTPKFGGLCYEGRITAGGGFMDSTAYCDYRELAKKVRESDINFFIYSGSNKDILGEYQDLAQLCEPVELKTLIKTIGRHEWGLVGNLTKHNQWDMTCPNKLFDYIAAGLPPVVMNAKWSAEFVMENDIGIVVESIEELKDRWGECNKYLGRVMKERERFSMDRHIHIVEELYAEVIR